MVSPLLMFDVPLEKSHISRRKYDIHEHYIWQVDWWIWTKIERILIDGQQWWQSRTIERGLGGSNEGVEDKVAIKGESDAEGVTSMVVKGSISGRVDGDGQQLFIHLK